MKTLNFKLIRKEFLEDRTLGILLLNGEFYGYTLEDTYRGDDVKIKHKTAIPTGNYELTLRYSKTYAEERVYVENVPMFEAIQFHGGNSPDDTSGCILIAKNRYKDQIQGSLKNKIIKDVEFSEFAFLEIVNLNQKQT